MLRAKCSVFAFLLAMVFFAGLARGQPSEIPAHLRDFYDKGVAAAKRQAWDEALDNFSVVRSNLPEYAPVYFNLGVVIEKLDAPVEAAACLQAYLALSPNAANAEAVRQAIDTLERKREAEIDAFFQQAAEALPAFPDYRRNDLYLTLARDNARAGRIGKALDLVKLIQQDSFYTLPIDRVPDLLIPGVWIEYAATLLGVELSDQGSDASVIYSLREIGNPTEAKVLLDRLEQVFPHPPPINNPNDQAGTKIDEVFKEVSDEAALLRRYIAKLAPTESQGSLTGQRARQVRFGADLTDLFHPSQRESFNMQASLKYKLGLGSLGGGAQGDTAKWMSKVAAEFGGQLFLFKLLRRAEAGVPSVVDGSEVEEALWKSICDSNEAQRFQGYLAWFPNGKHAELADATVRKLKAELKLVSPGPTPESVSIDEAIRQARAASKAQNAPEAFRWYRSAAERGNVDAQIQVAYMYQQGDGVPKDGAQALEWYRKAAEQGSARAGRYIGEAFHFGYGIPKNLEEAVRWYKWAAEEGDIQAYESLGYYYKETGNYSEAISYYRKAAAQLASAQVELGEMYEKGLGVPRSLNKAAYWYRLAANNKDFVAWNDSGLKGLERIGNPTPDPRP